MSGIFQHGAVSVFRYVGPVMLLFLAGAEYAPAETDTLTGRELMESVYERHRQYPYVYEDQSMVLIDRNGQRETRRLRRYSRVEEDGTAKFLLLFDSPQEVRGVALLATRAPDGNTHKSVYLPAYGNTMIESSGNGIDGNFLGSDFSVENLAGEDLSDYRYVRRRDMKLQDIAYHVVDVYRPDDDADADEPVKRHYILRDNLYIARTDYLDETGRLEKRQTHHDLKAVDGRMWRADMILMDNTREDHRTLIKIHDRVFSRDYVPAKMFTSEWIYNNHPSRVVREENENNGVSETVEHALTYEGDGS